MTISPAKGRESLSFALFASGANFSRLVLRYLLQSECIPDLIVLPQFPPAAQPGNRADLLNAEDDSNTLLRMLPRVDVEFLPKSQQLELAPKLAARNIDFGLIACWPYLMQAELIGTPARAMLNLHPSRLPHYRGVDPVGLQIDCDEAEGGVTLHLLNQQFDAGDIVAQAAFEISAEERERHWIEMKCAMLGVHLFVEAINAHPLGWQPRPQSDF